MTNSVSVIIPNFNYGRFLNRAIDSVLEQSHTNVEILVIDNGSTDNSREVLEGYGAQINAIFQENLGQALARNNGIARASGDFIALLDADDYWEPPKLEKQLALIDKDFQFVYTGLRQFESDTDSTVREIRPIFNGDCRMYFVKHPSRAIVPGGESSALMTRELVKKVGEFNPALNSASGRDFFRRCSAQTKFTFIDEALMNYRLHTSNMSRNLKPMMSDTVEAYRILFEDPEWQFEAKYRHKCLSRLHWSFFKTLLKKGEPFGAVQELLKVLVN